MRPFSVILGALVFALSCAADPPTRRAWTKPGGDPEQLEVARQSCLSNPPELQTQETSERLNARLAANRFVDCMEEQGWKRVAAP
ncbi:MAG: hypothetical protein VX574_05515 [Myxococcota bacterium]|nr:hypothetical protein [Myxococcota bacterium]